jgi:hypothetical protein
MMGRMVFMPRRVLARRLTVVVLAAFVVVVGLAACAGEDGEDPSASRSRVAASAVDDTRAAFGRAAQALRDRDRDAYYAALPTRGTDARRAVSDLYRRLSPLPWVSFSLIVTPVPGYEGRFLVQASGRLRGVGPSDRLAGERVLEVEAAGGQVRVVGDQTPAPVRRQYLMAFDEPLALRRNGLVVVGDRRARKWLESIAAAGAGARARLERLAIGSDEGVLVTVYRSGSQMSAAFAGGVSDERMRFFAHSTPRRDAAPWRRYDVAVLGPELTGLGPSVERVLAHELTHAYTVDWFLATDHAPTLLLEGLAEVVDGAGDGDSAALREELRAGNRLWPLSDALATGDLWAGNSYGDIDLAYTMAESLVAYVVSQWGVEALKPFCQAVANSDLSRGGLDRATRATLGVGWSRFYAGWKRSVLRP